MATPKEPNDPKRPDKPHDALFRQVMSHPDAFAGELRAVLPEAVAAQIDWTRLRPQSCSFVSAELRARFSDVLFVTRWAGREAFVYVLLEHQRKSDPLMAFRMLAYVVRIWERYLETNPAAKRLPAVIPVVVYAGADGAPWSHSVEVADLVDVEPSMAAALAGLLPRMRFVLDDLATVDAAALLARQPARVRVVLTLLKSAPGNRHLERDLSSLIADLMTLTTAELDRVLEYILVVGDTVVGDLLPVIDQLGPEIKEAFVTTAERLRAEGLAEGLAEGRAEGRAEMLIEQLSQKFGSVPSAVADAIRAQDPARLQAMGRRVLTAATLGDVIAE
ncbi:transposase [Nocardia uniformis]|uniref:Transposase n=1 Tax=Nocardia uniformis TaxID=53432 RepID=A0A849BYX4_9NOCA|nr:Rpn family recombination-promoting nuclease/putative transposase [Nocardia uniformis]NNH68867.1 transposase [Nocardia uniformis]